MESLGGRKLRHLFRTLPASQTLPASARVAAAFSSCCLAHNQRARRMEAALLPLCGQYYWTAAAARKGMAEQVRREGLSSTRWNPTKEQLRALEELYARGTRTPPAHQIQLIAAQLRRYGRIEGKNVFYWFQNHKARERQRLRRQAEEEAAAAAAAAASDDDDHNKQDSAGGAAPADSEVLIKQESKSLAPGKPYSSTPPATTSAAVARGRGEETAHSPWLLSHDQQGFAEGGAASQDTSQHQFPLGAGAAVSSGHCNKLVRSWASCGVLAGELDAEEEEEEEKPTTTLELFPLRSEKKNHHLVLGSSSACCNWKPSMISSHSHVQFFQFL